MKNRQIDKKAWKQVLVRADLHKLLKLKAVQAGTSIREFLEGYIAEALAVEEHDED
ncbi:hypothetical protein HZB58_01015 [Candidatus Gottesmanbacteria bacterium]|nr:hypothetical protein [Candidatus Gottesmanbacteria bacterium]